MLTSNKSHIFLLDCTSIPDVGSSNINVYVKKKRIVTFSRIHSADLTDICFILTSAFPIRDIDKQSFLFIPPDNSLARADLFGCSSINDKYLSASAVASFRETPFS